MLIDFIKKIIQKLFFKSKKNKNEIDCESSRRYQSIDDRKIDNALDAKFQTENVSEKDEKYTENIVDTVIEEVQTEKENADEEISEIEEENILDNVVDTVVEEVQTEKENVGKEVFEIEEKNILYSVVDTVVTEVQAEKENTDEEISEIEEENILDSVVDTVVEEVQTEKNADKEISEIEEENNDIINEKFLRDEEERIRKKILLEQTNVNIKNTVTDKPKQYKKESERKTDKIVLSDKKIDEKDKKLKKWKRSIYDIDFSSDKLMEYIIDQMKDLRDKYYNNYPLGFVKLGTEQYIELKKRCKSYVVNPPESFTPYCCIVMSLTMIHFVIKEKKTDNFWNDFFTSFGVEYSPTKRDSFCKAFLYLCINEDFYFDYFNGKRRYVETIKIHAVISEHTITNVFDAISSYYSEVMNEIYNDDTIEDYTNDFLDIMKGSSDTEIYNIPSAFKIACKVFENVMFDCISNTLYNMNSKNYRRSVFKKTPTAFYSHYMNWTIICESRRRKQKKIQDVNISVGESIRHYTKAEFSLGNDLELLIHIPKIEIPENMIQEEIFLKFYNNGSEIYELRKNMNVSGMFRFYTDETEKVLPCLYKNLSCRITAGNFIIYDSLKMMYRDFIVFDNSFDEYTSKKIPEDNLFLLTDKIDDVSLDCYSEIKRNDNLKIYALSAENDSELYVNSSPVFRTSGDENVVIGLRGGKHIRGTKIITDGNVYNVWSILPDIILSFEKMELLDEYTFELSGIKQGRLLEFLDENSCINLGKLIETQDELHIIIKNKSGKIIWDYAVVFVPGYVCKFDKEFYYKEKYAELLDISADNLDFSENDFPVMCETESDYIYIDADKNGEKVKIQLSIPLISWGIGDSIGSKGDVYILGSELPDNAMLKVKAPFEYKIIAANQNGMKFLKTKHGKADISVLKTSNADYTSVGIMCGKIQVKLFEVIHKACIREFYINTFEQGKQLEISYQLFGQAEVIITAIPYGEEDGTEIFHSDKSENCMIPLELPSGRYRIIVELEESDEFGFETQRKLAENREIFIGDEFETFCQSVSELKIEKCLTDKILPVRNFYLKNIRKVVDEYLYTGIAYFYAVSKYNGESYQQEFKQANPVIIRVLEVSDTEYKVLITDSEYDGFIYNKLSQYLIYDDKGIKDKNLFDVPDIYIISKSQRSFEK